MKCDGNCGKTSAEHNNLCDVWTPDELRETIAQAMLLAVAGDTDGAMDLVEATPMAVQEAFLYIVENGKLPPGGINL